MLALSAALGTVAAALVLRAVVAGPVAKYGGDALYTVLLYTLAVTAAPRIRPATAAALSLLASWAVEFAQLTGVPAQLSAQSPLARLVLGSTFNPPDLAWYAAGAALAWAVHTAATRPRPGGHESIRPTHARTRPGHDDARPAHDPDNAWTTRGHGGARTAAGRDGARPDG
ncbi:hypothetical protein Sru01_11360 [Sphaerisporangium rufum]|uniref:DUF2809 domain-containing protein n=1 Tax=Sphaerisporangium rufum TaxID=1381558 RepID=A0A919UXS6_9ACTN|nr:hypothetical protein Sru01_11360 [Sphaerisporangium rufum]